MARKVIRLEITAGTSVFYLVIEKNEVHLFHPSGREIDLLHLASNKAMVLRFLLEDAMTSAGAIKYIKHVLPGVTAKEWTLL